MIIFLVWFVLCVLFGYVCYTDIRYRIINNYATFVICLLSIIIGYTASGSVSFTALLFILIVGFFLSVANIMGAGDIKLLAVLSLSFSSGGTCLFLFLTSLAGLIVALVILLASAGGRQAVRRKSVPYGVAIVSGYLATAVLLRMSA